MSCTLKVLGLCVVLSDGKLLSLSLSLSLRVSKLQGIWRKSEREKTHSTCSMQKDERTRVANERVEREQEGPNGEMCRGLQYLKVEGQAVYRAILMHLMEQWHRYFSLLNVAKICMEKLLRYRWFYACVIALRERERERERNKNKRPNYKDTSGWNL